jgi:heterotetrameric sarcosine oxidase gamma subunit
MTLAFLQAEGATGVMARSPMADATEAAGATFAGRDGWWVASSFGDERQERLACAEAVGWADVSHLGKLEIQAADPGQLASLAGGLRLGHAVAARGAWWCLVTPVRALLFCESAVTAGLREELEAVPGFRVVDVTTQFSALRLGGPQARETFARFCALDLRADRVPVGAFLPASVARTPGFVLREAPDQYLVVTGSAVAIHLWTVVTDAGKRLGGRPVGADVLPSPIAPREEAGTHA